MIAQSRLPLAASGQLSPLRFVRSDVSVIVMLVERSVNHEKREARMDSSRLDEMLCPNMLSVIIPHHALRMTWFDTKMP